jgi:hypothetical protein
MKKYILAALLAVTPFTTMANVTVDPTIDNSYTLSCTQPIEREDGTPLAIGEIAKNNFYVGTTPGNYTETIENLPPTCSLTVDATAVADGSYYYVVTVVDTDGRESMYSTPFVVTVQRVKPPKAPTWQ